MSHPAALAGPGATVLLALAHLALVAAAFVSIRRTLCTRRTRRPRRSGLRPPGLHPLFTGFHVFLGLQAVTYGLRPLLNLLTGRYLLYGTPAALLPGGAAASFVPPAAVEPAAWAAYNRGLALQLLFAGAVVAGYALASRRLAGDPAPKLALAAPPDPEPARGVEERGEGAGQGRWEDHPGVPDPDRTLIVAWGLSLLAGTVAAGAMHFLSGGAWLPGHRGGTTVTAAVPYGKLLFPLAVIPLTASLPLARAVAARRRSFRRPSPHRRCSPGPGTGFHLLLGAGSLWAVALLLLLYQRGYLLTALLATAFVDDWIRPWTARRLAVLVAAGFIILGGARPLATALAGVVPVPVASLPGAAGPAGRGEAAEGVPRAVRPPAGGASDPAPAPVMPACALPWTTPPATLPASSGPAAPGASRPPASALSGALPPPVIKVLHFLARSANFDGPDVWVLAQGFTRQHGHLGGRTLAAVPARVLTPAARGQHCLLTAADVLNTYRWRQFYWQTRFGFNVSLAQEAYLNFGAPALPVAGALAGLLAAAGDRAITGRRHPAHRGAPLPSSLLQPPSLRPLSLRPRPPHRLPAALSLPRQQLPSPLQIYAACAILAAAAFTKEPAATLQWTAAYLLAGAGLQVLSQAVARPRPTGGTGRTERPQRTSRIQRTPRHHQTNEIHRIHRTHLNQRTNRFDRTLLTPLIHLAHLARLAGQPDPSRPGPTGTPGPAGQNEPRARSVPGDRPGPATTGRAPQRPTLIARTIAAKSPTTSPTTTAATATTTTTTVAAATPATVPADPTAMRPSVSGGGPCPRPAPPPGPTATHPSPTASSATVPARRPVRVVICRSNPVDPDPRVERVARTLAGAGYQVTVVGGNRTVFGHGLANLPAWLGWQLRLLVWLVRHARATDVIHACDFDTLIPALVVKGLSVRWRFDRPRGFAVRPGAYRRFLAACLRGPGHKSGARRRGFTTRSRASAPSSGAHRSCFGTRPRGSTRSPGAHHPCSGAGRHCLAARPRRSTAFRATARIAVVYDIFDWYADTVTGLPDPARHLLAALDRRLLTLADAVILADEGRLPQLGPARPRRLEVIYNSPDWTDPGGTGEQGAGEPRPAPRLRLKLAHVGTLQPGRGLRELLAVLRRHPDWHLDLAGFGPDEPALRQAAQSMPNVRFHGRVDHATCRDLYARADVIPALYDPAVPNHRYASPSKVLEALALGKPVIVAQGTGIDRRIRQYRLGWVVPYGDEHALESALAAAAAWNTAARQAFARRSRNRYQTYWAWPRMEKRLLRLYRDLVALKKDPPALTNSKKEPGGSTGGSGAVLGVQGGSGTRGVPTGIRNTKSVRHRRPAPGGPEGGPGSGCSRGPRVSTWRSGLALGAGAPGAGKATALLKALLGARKLVAPGAVPWRRNSAPRVLIGRHVPPHLRREITLRALAHGMAVDLIPDPYEVLVASARWSRLGDAPLLRIGPLEPSPLARLAKRLLDVVGSLVLLVLFAWVFALIPLLIWLYDRGPVLYRQTRLGLHGRPFTILKFRTMVVDAERATGPVWARQDDPRVTRIGRLLRATHLDELPQLVNVLRGEVSLVGPRPERPELAARFSLDEPAFRLREAVKPGLTGLAQVEGVYQTSPTVKLLWDLRYMAGWRLFRDIMVLLRTVGRILFRVWGPSAGAPPSTTPTSGSWPRAMWRRTGSAAGRPWPPSRPGS